MLEVGVDISDKLVMYVANGDQARKKLKLLARAKEISLLL